MNLVSNFTAVCRRHADVRGNRCAYAFSDGDDITSTMTFEQLSHGSRALATALLEQALLQERVLLLFDAAQDFVRAFFGCLYAGVIAVPVNLPSRKGRLEKVRGIAQDAAARVALTTAKLAEELAGQGLGLRCLVLEELVQDSLGHAASYREPPLSGSSTAFLQYTSGSTGTPKGVVVSHANLLANEAMVKAGFGHDEQTVFTGWLPLFHDMGLVGNMLHPAYLGVPCTLMPPMAFVQQPVRWLKLISSARATTSGAPNFAYELCVRRIDPADMVGVDLSSWQVAFNGAEPIQAATLERFSEKFAPYGFRRTSFYPCYGMAEGTLFIAGGLAQEAPVFREVSSKQLEAGDVSASLSAPSQPLDRRLVGCGRPWGDEEILAVDQYSRAVCSDGKVGEIWVSGSNVAAGYWQQPALSTEVFQALTVDGRGPFLRTGDLGFMWQDELFVTGRLKDLIIVAGKNHYPHDIELTASSAHDALRGRPGAAFSLSTDAGELVALVQEVDMTAARAGLCPATLEQRVRDAVMAEHGVALKQLLFIKQTTLPMTTSGKVQRSLCRSMLLNGRLDDVFLTLQPQVNL